MSWWSARGSIRNGCLLGSWEENTGAVAGKLTVKKYPWPRLIIPAHKDLFLRSLHPFSLVLISSYFLHSLVPIVFFASNSGPLSLLDSLGICVPGHQLWFLGRRCPIWCELYLGSYINFFFLMVQKDIWVELNSTLKIILHSTGLENIFYWTIFWASYLHYGLKTIKKGPVPPWEEDAALFFWWKWEKRTFPPLWGLCYFSWGS